MANLIRKSSNLSLLRFLCGNTKKNSVCLSNQINGKCFHTSQNLEKIIAFNLSDIGEGIREVVVKEWYVKEGDEVSQFDDICEVQSDKASVTITSRYDGIVSKIHHKVDDIALVGKPLLDFDVIDEEEESGTSSDEKLTTKDKFEEQDNEFSLMNQISKSDGTRIKVLATPAVRRIAIENKVNLNDVMATGKQGRVLKGDILKYLENGSDTKPIPVKIERKQELTPTETQKEFKPILQDTILPIKGVQKAMFKSMTESLKIPHFGYADEVDLTNLLKLRNDIKEYAQSQGLKVTFMPFFIKAASNALLKYPILNSVVDEKNENLILKATHNISIAMDTPQGLVVPNIKNCQQKSIIQIARELTELHKKGQSNTLKPDDFANGTFSLSNIGIIGGTYLHPCVMSPQVAIGAIGKTRVVPRFGKNDEIVKASIVNVSWTADHRVLDGATVANFSNLWKLHLENPGIFFLSEM